MKSTEHEVCGNRLTVTLVGVNYCVPGIFYLELCTWNFVPGILYLELCTWNFVPGILYLEFCTWNFVHSIGQKSIALPFLKS
jgi:hypothetical protein